MVSPQSWVVLPVALMASGLFASCRDDDPPPPPSTLVVIAVAGSPAPLRVFDAVTGETRFEGKPGKWFAPAFSPDGKRLFAIKLPEDREADDFELHFIEVAGGKADTSRVPVADIAGMAWAPDSSRFAFSGSSGLVVTDPQGRRRGETIAAQPRGGGGFRGGGAQWSKDSQFVAGFINDEILLATRDGKSAGMVRAEDFPTVQPGDQLQLMMWLDDGRLAVLLGSRERNPPAMFAVSVADGAVKATPYDQEINAILESELAPAEADRAEAERLVPGGRVGAPVKTADGSGRWVEVAGQSGSPTRSQLVLFTSGGSLVIDPGQAGQGGFLNRSLSVVIIK